MYSALCHRAFALIAMVVFASAQQEEGVIGYAADTDNAYIMCWQAHNLTCGWYCTESLIVTTDGDSMTVATNALPTDSACGDCSDYIGDGTVSSDYAFAQGSFDEINVSWALFYNDKTSQVILTYDADRSNNTYDNLCRLQYTVLDGSVLGHEPPKEIPLTQGWDGAELRMLPNTTNFTWAGSGPLPPNRTQFVPCTDQRNKPYCTEFSVRIAYDVAVVVPLIETDTCPSYNLVFTTIDQGLYPEPNYRGHNTDQRGGWLARDGDNILVVTNSYTPYYDADGALTFFVCQAKFNVTSGCVMGLGPVGDTCSYDFPDSSDLPTYDTKLGRDFVIVTSVPDEGCAEPGQASRCTQFCTFAFNVTTTNVANLGGTFGIPLQAGTINLFPSQDGGECDCSGWQGLGAVADYGTVAQGAFDNDVLFTLFLDDKEHDPVMMLDSHAEKWCYIEYKQVYPANTESLLVNVLREPAATVADAVLSLNEVSRTGQGTDCSEYPACTAWTMIVATNVAVVSAEDGSGVCPQLVAAYQGNSMFRGLDEAGHALNVSVSGDEIVVVSSTDQDVCTVAYEVTGGCLLTAGKCDESSLGGGEDGGDDDGAVVALAVVATLLAAIVIVLGVMYYRLRKEMTEADASQHVSAA